MGLPNPLVIMVLSVEEDPGGEGAELRMRVHIDHIRIRRLKKARNQPYRKTWSRAGSESVGRRKKYRIRIHNSGGGGDGSRSSNIFHRFYPSPHLL